MEALTQARLKELLHYNPETGVFTWLSHHWRRSIGKSAGTKTATGYIQIDINRKPFYAHRLAWLYVYGEFPKYHIDHINIVRDDNRLANLRACEPLENSWNVKKRSHNKTGFRGVYWNKRAKKFRAQISICKVKTYLGEYDTPEQASAAYEAKAKELHGAFYREANK